MKALIYKELKLAMHPICYVFVAAFPLMILIPSYPIGIGFIYLLSAYPILFLGANKGQQSNDLLFSTLLPVRKKDIVLARMITVIIMQFVFMALMSLLSPVAQLIRNSIIASDGELEDVGLGLNAFVSTLGIALIGFSLADLVFFPIYYKNGKSIVMSTLLTILAFVVYIAIFTILLTYIPGLEWYKETLSGEIWIQFIVLGVSLLIYALIHLLTYKISAKRLEKVDF